MTRLKSRQTIVIGLLIVMIVQCMVLVYWHGQKGNYFLDELYTFEHARNYTFDEDVYFMSDPSWQYETWMDADGMLSHLTVAQGEGLRSLPFTESLHLLLTKRTYMGMMNLIMSATTPFDGYATGALILNMVFFFLAELLLFYCIKTLTGRKELALLSIIMFGCSGIIMSMCTYIRFYMLAIMLLLIVIACHIKLWDTRNYTRFFGWELLAFLAAYYGMKHSELMFMICGTFFCLFFFSLLIRKQFRASLIYALPLLAGTYWFVYRKTYLIEMVLHPSAFVQPDDYGKGTIAYNLMTVTWERASGTIATLWDCVYDKWFGGLAVFIVFAAAGLGYFILFVVQRKKADQKAFSGAGRNGYSGLVLLILLTALIGLTFNVLTDMYSNRYSSFEVVLLMICFWYGIGQLCRYDFKWRPVFLAAIAAITLWGAVMGQQADHFAYLYPKSKEVTTAVKQYEDLDCVFFQGATEENYDLGLERHAFYDCIVHTGFDAKVYVMDPLRAGSLKEIDPPDRFLAWCFWSGGDNRMKRLMDGSDYEITPLGATHMNYIYLCEKK